VATGGVETPLRPKHALSDRAPLVKFP
jgi:hypothetical protein